MEEYKEGETHYAHLSDLGRVRKIHIVKVIDEGLCYCPMIVYRYWSKIKKRWVYNLDSEMSLSASIDRVKL